MDKKKILFMARQAGIQQPENHAAWVDICASAIAAERESCAKVCDEKYERHADNGFPREASTARALAEAIRKRSN